MSGWRGRPGEVPPIVPTTEPAGCVNNTHSYRCQRCGRSVSLGATCECNVVLADDRIAAALERIAAALERLAPAHVGVRLDEGQIIAAFNAGRGAPPPAAGPTEP